MERATGKVLGQDGAVVCAGVTFQYDIGRINCVWGGSFVLRSQVSGSLLQPQLTMELNDGRRARIVVPRLTNPVQFIGSGPPPSNA